jgi:hypothetical protein
MKWQKENAEHRKQYMRDYNYKLKYDVSLARYNEILKEQGGLCACCKNPDYRKPLAIDHDHETGSIRGLLCHTCNNHLGIYQKKRDMFEAYLSGGRR